MQQETDFLHLLKEHSFVLFIVASVIIVGLMFVIAMLLHRGRGGRDR